jgi:hypothetical protein
MPFQLAGAQTVAKSVGVLEALVKIGGPIGVGVDTSFNEQHQTWIARRSTSSRRF